MFLKARTLESEQKNAKNYHLYNTLDFTVAAITKYSKQLKADFNMLELWESKACLSCLSCLGVNLL